ncbi:peptide chain release factor N(5)-glutamine methyltransferase [Methylotenera versatilis]|uniref:Release factor glutamine methyltransferase n=1 Tax=Methylotenera versatilis (strain 301) TaxID=666681 RepID=D7DNE2_METV0|nr:peptide chain release factor N(5)-glutamine methyltransferase [Methylotenera versatilis]ADI30943.1 protein-(glutamine-N5) methyltransferase, release factor-specific [Methylotenera versatilis 301]
MPASHSIKAILADASVLLSTEEAKLEAQLLLQHVLNVNRAWLIAHANDALQPNIHAAFEAQLKRRLAGEPMAYILGNREFYGLDLLVTPDTLIPRPDTETLVEAALAKIPLSESTKNLSFRRKSESSGVEQHDYETLDSDFRRNDDLKVLDLGTGTGAIALAIAKNRPKASITAVDASDAALEIAKQNSQQLSIINVEFTLSNWFENLSNQRFDVIVSNPPYIEEHDAHLTQGDLRFEPLSALASGMDGLDDIRQIIGDCLIYLKPQGWLMLEHGYNQAEQVADLMADAGLTNIETIKDLGNNDRVTIGKNPLIVSTHWD